MWRQSLIEEHTSKTTIHNMMITCKSISMQKSLIVYSVRKMPQGATTASVMPACLSISKTGFHPNIVMHHMARDKTVVRLAHEPVRDHTQWPLYCVQFSMKPRWYCAAH